MVTFQCQTCIKTLKKKQIERHYQFECRHANGFECLTCWKTFDRESVKAHISCTTEAEMYQKGDQTKKPTIVHKPLADNKDNPKLNKFDDLTWSGIRKTAKKVLTRCEFFKSDIGKLTQVLSEIYSKFKKVNMDNVDSDMLKKSMMNKLESEDKFVIDLSKNTIRYKQ